MSVHREEKKTDYTIISNSYLRDRNLSLKAKGLLTVMLSLPDTWEYSVRGLASICAESTGAVNRSLQELEDKGYLVRHQIRLNNGHAGRIVYDIYEKASDHPAGSPKSGETVKEIRHNRCAAERNETETEPCVQKRCTENEHTDNEPCAEIPYTENAHTEKQPYMGNRHALSAYPLLIIDDLGIERNTEYAKEQVYAVIDERYKAGLPLIVTTNMTIDQIHRPNNLADARIMSRILEMCTPVQIGGKDRREETGRNKQETVKAF